MLTFWFGVNPIEILSVITLMYPLSGWCVMDSITHSLLLTTILFPTASLAALMDVLIGFGGVEACDSCVCGDLGDLDIIFVLLIIASEIILNRCVVLSLIV
jgi:hypothetical protein